jgi:putative oxidoreductase
MPQSLQAPLAILGRLCLVAIFALSAVSNKIPNFNKVTHDMAAVGVPIPTVALASAIVFLLVGSVLIAVGYRAHFGALLLLLFLIPATYYFHAPWKAATPGEATQQLIHLLKNLGLMGAMLLIMASGPGAGSLDGRKSRARAFRWTRAWRRIGPSKSREIGECLVGGAPRDSHRRTVFKGWMSPCRPMSRQPMRIKIVVGRSRSWSES